MPSDFSPALQQALTGLSAPAQTLEQLHEILQPALDLAVQRMQARAGMLVLPGEARSFTALISGQACEQRREGLLGSAELEHGLNRLPAGLHSLAPGQAPLLAELLTPPPRRILALGMDAPERQPGAPNLGVLLLADPANESAAPDLLSLGQLLALRVALWKTAAESAQRARLATTGRITSYLVHEISNSLQAMRGAATLLIDDLNSPQELATDLGLMQQELDRASAITGRMRALYRPPIEPPALISLANILDETLHAVRNEFKRQNVQIQCDLYDPSAQTIGNAQPLLLGALNLLFGLFDTLGPAGGALSIVLQEEAGQPALLASAKGAQSEINPHNLAAAREFFAASLQELTVEKQGDQISARVIFNGAK